MMKYNVRIENYGSQMSSVMFAGDLRKGKYVRHKGEICHVDDTNFSRQGRGGSTIHLKLKSLGGFQRNPSFNSSDKLDIVEVRTEYTEYLYDDGDLIYCTDGTFHNYSLVDESSRLLLKDAPQDPDFSMPLSVNLIDGEVVKISVARLVPVRVVETEPFLKGQTVTTTYKKAKLSNGMSIQVPQHVEDDTYILVNTEDSDDWRYESKFESKQ